MAVTSFEDPSAYDDLIEVVKEMGAGANITASTIQRRLRVPYKTAEQLLLRLVKDGYVAQDDRVWSGVMMDGIILHGRETKLYRIVDSDI